jgi:hypothetical protein
MMEDNSGHVTLSTITPGSAGTWHYLEAWQAGVASQVLFRFDNESPLTLTTGTAFGAPLCLQFEANNGSTALQTQLDIDHVVVLSPGNAVLPLA